MMVRNPAKLCFVGVALFLLCASECWAQQPVTTDTKLTERPGGAITGRVTNSAGEPLSGAVAYVGPLGSGARSQTTAVDNNGEFKIEGLEAGVYRVSASMPGYIPAPQPSPTDSPTYYHIGDSVTVTLIKGAVITGTVSGPNGPVIAASVRAIRVRDDDGKALLSAVVIRERLTDDRGIYRIYGLPPGAYLIVAGGAQQFGGPAAYSAYGNDSPIYFPSSARDTASEVVVRNGEEITADIQYRSEPGHSISGTVGGLVQLQTQISYGATIGLIAVRDRSTFMNTSASSYNNYAFAFYGVPDGEYELSASQFVPNNSDYLRSTPRRVVVRGADVAGVNLTVAPLASIAGRLVFENDPKAGCAKRRETAAQETLVFARRYEPEKKAEADTKPPAAPEVSITSTNYVSDGVADAKGSFTLRNLPPGTYRIDPRAPASGWYLRSISSGAVQTTAARNAITPVAGDNLTLKTGERVSGLTVTFTEGAASLRSRISAPEGQSIPPRMRLYLVPAEAESTKNVLRFFEAAAESDGTFTVANIAPGRYWIVARPFDEKDPTRLKSIRQDSTLRAQVLHEAEVAKKEISFKPCERVADYDLKFAPALPPK
jgi:hypothetical protein